MGIISILKRAFYFPVASYFKFFAAIRLLIWNPRVIVITGSSGKTTTMHFIKSQLGEEARYSEKANSAFGVPFDILGISRKTLLPTEWPLLFLGAPINAFRKPFKEKLYVVEADCDRPGEGEFLAELLRPEVTIWLSISRSHSANFENEIGEVEKVIAKEFGYFIKKTKSLAIVNFDNKYIAHQIDKTKAKVIGITQKKLTKYSLGKDGAKFEIQSKEYNVPFLLPEETAYSLQAMEDLLQYLGRPEDLTFSNLSLPPGRSSLFNGIKNTTIIDSSYNASLESMAAMLNLFDIYPSSKKWAVLGDMVEQGRYTKEEHEKVAEIILKMKLEKVILVGPRVLEYVYPKIVNDSKNTPDVVRFEMPYDALEYLKASLVGNETILFKGARFLEGIIEHLLENKRDIDKLCRREKVWQERRKKWGL